MLNMSTLYRQIIKVIWKDFFRNFFFTQLCDFRENRPYPIAHTYYISERIVGNSELKKMAAPFGGGLKPDLFVDVTASLAYFADIGLYR